MLINTRRLITEQTIEENLMTSLGGSPPLDIFIRTSGVKRLSGFLQWQVCLYSFPVFHLPINNPCSFCLFIFHLSGHSFSGENGIYSSKMSFSPNSFVLLTVL